jgi:glycerophosphoryl diester phosphodiesterase
MPFICVRVLLFDPSVHDEPERDGIPVTSDITVDVARFPGYRPEAPDQVIPLRGDPATGLFVGELGPGTVNEEWFFRITFERRNFSLRLGKLLHPSEVTPDAEPVLAPGRLPVWDSGWDDGYETNEFFGEEGLRVPATPERPIVLTVPVRRVYVIGHRGAPFFYPENTIASYRKALEVGANALEFDLCMTKDRRIAVFHDPRLDTVRRMFESLPYELVSPEIRNRWALIKAFVSGEYRIIRRRPVLNRSSLDIVKLSYDQVRMFYRYHHVEGVEHPVPELEEFLKFVVTGGSRLKMLFFDVKNAPAWGLRRHRRRFREYGRLIGETLQEFPVLPETLVVANENEQVLAALKEGILGAGEGRCQFALDAAGSAAALFGLKDNPLAMARRLGNEVVSVGSLARAGDLDEIIEAARDRDYNPASRLLTVLHWTLNDPGRMRESFRGGVNGIVTDKPDLLRAIMDELGVYVN